MADARVKIKETGHLFTMGMGAGLMEAQELLESLPQGLRQTPGVALAIATIAAKANESRGATVAKNLAMIARAGHDVGRYKSVTFDPNTAELICEFYDPDLFDSGEEG